MIEINQLSSFFLLIKLYFIIDVKADQTPVSQDVLFYSIDNLNLYFKHKSYLIVTNSQFIPKGNELAGSASNPSLEFVSEVSEKFF